MRALRVAACALWLAGCGASQASVNRGGETRAAPNQQAVRLLVTGGGQLKRGTQKSLARAQKTLEKAIAIDPALWEAHYDLGLTLRRRGDLEGASERLRTAEDLSEGAPEPVLALAECELALGNASAAEGLLERLVQATPADVPARLSLAAVYRQRNKLELALRQAREVLIRNPRETRGLLEVGRIYRAQGELDIAELVLDKARTLDPNSAAAHNELGLLALDRGDTQRAFTHFADAQRADTRYAPAHINQASVLLQAGDFEGAKSAYRAALKAAPDTQDARVGLAIALRGQGRHKQAQKEYERVLSEHPTHLAALFDLAILHADFLDQRKEALALFDKYLALAPKSHSHRATAERYVEDIRMALGSTP